MKSLLCVVLIAFVAQVSAQNRPDLSCFICDDCTRVESDTPRRSCYQALPAPERVTVPPPVVLTPAPAPGTAVVPENLVPMNTPRQGQLFTCFTIRREVGDRGLTHRGCAPIHQTDELTCSYQNQMENPDLCWLCADDECNNQVAGVSKAFASVALLFTVLLATLRFI